VRCQVRGAWEVGGEAAGLGGIGAVLEDVVWDLGDHGEEWRRGVGIVFRRVVENLGLDCAGWDVM
jgi:hypothetical protein